MPTRMSQGITVAEAETPAVASPSASTWRSKTITSTQDPDSAPLTPQAPVEPNTKRPHPNPCPMKAAPPTPPADVPLSCELAKVERDVIGSS